MYWAFFGNSHVLETPASRGETAFLLWVGLLASFLIARASVAFNEAQFCGNEVTSEMTN